MARKRKKDKPTPPALEGARLLHALSGHERLLVVESLAGFCALSVAFKELDVNPGKLEIFPTNGDFYARFQGYPSTTLLYKQRPSKAEWSKVVKYWPDLTIVGWSESDLLDTRFERAKADLTRGKVVGLGLLLFALCFGAWWVKGSDFVHDLSELVLVLAGIYLAVFGLYSGIAQGLVAAIPAGTSEISGRTYRQDQVLLDLTLAPIGLSMLAFALSYIEPAASPDEVGNYIALVTSAFGFCFSFAALYCLISPLLDTVNFLVDRNMRIQTLSRIRDKINDEEG